MSARFLKIAFAAALAFALALPAAAQKPPSEELGFQPGKLYDFSEVDSVNLYNGNLMLTVPLGPKYQVGAKLSYRFTLVYNGRMWDVETFTCQDIGTCRTLRANRRSNAGAGWRVSFGRLLPPYEPSRQSSSDERDLWIYEGPTGDEHPFADGSPGIAADASALRLIFTDADTRDVEFPTGEVHRFKRHHNDWRLESMSDRNGNSVTFTYQNDPADDRRIIKTTIKDTVGRTQTITYKNYSSMGESVEYGQQVSTLSLTGANGVTASYGLEYILASVKLNYPAGSTDRTFIPLLQYVKQPDGTQFELDYYTDPAPADGFGQGAIRQIKLPTGGSIEYHYQPYTLPTRQMCPGVIETTIDPAAAGIKSRTISTGDPTDDAVWEYVQSAGPVVPHEMPPGDLCGAGVPFLVPVGPIYWTRTAVLSPIERTVTGATTRTRTDHYFDGYSRAFPMEWSFGCPAPAADGTCPGFNYPGAMAMPKAEEARKKPVPGFDYSKPPDVKAFDSAGRRITTQIYSGCTTDGDCTNGTLERSTYTLYEQHPLSVKHTAYPYGEGEVPPSLQLKASRTVYETDSGCTGGEACYTDSTSSDDNGAGQYRQVVTDSNFPGKKKLTSRTEFETWDSARVHDKDEHWITNLYTGQSQVEEGGETLRQLSCFDPINGFLRFQRVLNDPSKLSKNDVLNVFTETSHGDIRFIKSYGGDKQAVLDEGTIPTDVCSMTLPSETPWYSVENSYNTTLASGGGDYYTGGLLVWSRYYDRDTNTALGFKTVDRVIDRYTGVVLRDRDTAGFTTAYEYDAKPNRLMSVQPPGAAKSSYQYINATPYKHAYVTETVTGNSGVINDNTYEFDGQGRLIRTSKSLPNGKYAVVQTDYDPLGRQSRVSQPVEKSEHPFSAAGDYWTQFYYDAFNRKTLVLAPDFSRTSFTYTGIRKLERETFNLATSIGGTSSARVTELYDDQGRLVQVDEASGDTSAAKTEGDDVATKYTYHLNGKLATVNMQHGSDKQERTFDYDGRGFLDKESHPETQDENVAGVEFTDYDDYDARGHAWKRTVGGKTVELTYDSAERVTNASGASGPLKEFKFGTAGTNKGKLWTAIRHNERDAAGLVDVKETYFYDSPSGQMSRRTTLVERVVKNGDGTETRTPIQEFDYSVDYDELLQPKTVTMPTCRFYGCRVEKGLPSVTNERTAGYLTSVDGFGSLTYHPSGMVESVRHETPNHPTDTYDERFGMPRPSKITFTGCTSTEPYFLPGVVRTKVDPNACGIQVTWPAATLCGGASNIKYHVLRDGVDITEGCLTATKFVDRTAVRGNTYNYTIVAEGPQTEGGIGTCQGGKTVQIMAKPFAFNSCDADTQLTVQNVRASVGVGSRFEAYLGSANGPLPDELLTFTVLGSVLGTARTGTDGKAVVDRTIDVDPGTYPGGISVTYAGGLFPAKTTTADLVAACDGPSYGVKPLSLNVLAAGGSFPVVVLTSSRCSWTPIPRLASFIGVYPPTQQKGTGTFSIGVPALEGSGTRSSYVRVSDKEVTVEQSSTCSFHFSPELAYVPYKTSFTTSINVSASAGCAWSVASDSSWLHLSRSSGNGDGFITFTVDTNNNNPRVATLSLNGGEDTAKVNQAGPPSVVCPRLVDDLQGPGSVQNGQFISLRAHVEGTYLEYEWWVNGRPHGKCTDDKCEAFNLAPGSGDYPAAGQSSTFQLVVSNSCDTVVTREITVHNLGGSCRVPIITDSLLRDFAPYDVNSPFGGYEVQLWVVGINTGTGDLKFQWYHNFAGDRSEKVSDLEGGNTDTIHVRPSRTSFYWVEVTNDCGSNISRTGAVYVVPYVPPRIRRRAVSKDFTGDGKADILWHNVSTGLTEIWPMNGATQSGPTISLPPTSVAAAQLQSVGDINDDSRPDLIFRDPQTGKNEAWTVSGSIVRSVLPLDNRADGRWSIGGVADLDNDYNDDIIWHNNTTGENEIWFQDGTAHEGTWALPSNDGSGWGLHGADDFNGDGKPDLFFHDRNTGANSIWYMNDAERSFAVGTNEEGGASSSTARRKLQAKMETMSTSLAPEWMPAMVGDMDGDGGPDIVWRNAATGENQVWLMNGATVASTVELPPRSGSDWQIGGGGSTNAGTPAPGSDPRTATTLSVTADPAPLGTAAAMTATLTAGSSPVAQRQVVFSLNGVEFARLLTDADGSATAAASVSGLAAGTYADAITVRFDGDAVYNSSGAKTSLVVLAPTPEVTWTNPDAIVYGTPLSATQLNATANVAGTFVYSPPAGTVLNAGYQTLTVIFTPSDASIAPITRNAVLFINKAPSSVTWAAPAAIAYGTPLSDVQLNATAALPGELDYDPEAGTVLPVGAARTLRVTFTPASANYDVSTATTTIDVTKGQQLIRWSNPAPLPYGQPLTAAQLNATVITTGAEAAGPLTYEPAAGTLLDEGVHELKVSAAETASYLPSTASVDIVVTRQAPAITWNNPAAIVYGMPLSATQLNATATVAGTFTYTPAAGTILDSGFQTLHVLFTPAESRYTQATATVVIEVRKARPVVVWNTPAAIIYGTPLSPAQLNATSATPGEFTYAPRIGTILDAGTRELVVDYLPHDIRNYELVTAKVSLQVLKAPQTITWADPAAIVYGTALSATQLNATVQVPGPSPAGALTYVPSAGTVLQAGAAQPLTVTAAETSNYNAATATVHLDVLKATPVITWPSPASIIYKTLLGAQQLNATANVPGTFAYTPAAGTLLEAGLHTLSAQFTPSDTRNYNDASQSVTLEVLRGDPVLSWTRPAGIVYGTALSATQLNATADVAGAFVYTPAAGTILDAGDGQALSAHFTPSDTGNYNEGDVATKIDVAKAPQRIVWTSPAAIVYGTALSATQLNATIEVVGPAGAGALTYTPATGTLLDAGLHQTLSVSVAETANYLPNSATVTLDVLRAPLALVVDAKSKLYGGVVPPLTGVLTGVVNGDSITPSYATTATQQSVVGTYPITATLVDPNGRLVNYDVTVTPSTLTVLPAPLTIAAVAASKQYSDPLPLLEATFTGLVLNETPAVLAGTLSIVTTAERLSAPGTYPISIGGLTSTNYAITYAGSTFTVMPEDARVAVISPLLVSAAPSGATTIAMMATVRDISATADAAGDVDAGDIRNATLTFVDRATGTTLCTAPLGLTNDTDARVATAMCTFTRDFGAVLPASLVIESRVGGYYTRDAAADDVTLEITEPTSDFINAAGSIAIASPAGSYGPSAASKPRFELNLKYDNKGVAQGRLVLTFSRAVDGVERQYELSADANASLSVRRTAAGGVAAIVGTATLRDVTTKSAAVIIADAAPLIVTATDGGQPSASDAISFTLYKRTGGLWTATGWDGGLAVEQPLDNGAVVIHYGQ